MGTACQLLFVVCDGDSITIDFIALEPMLGDERGLRPGWPVSLALAIDERNPTGVLAAERLLAWAGGLAVVDVDVLDVGNGVDVVFEHSGQQVVLSATDGVWHNR